MRQIIANFPTFFERKKVKILLIIKLVSRVEYNMFLNERYRRFPIIPAWNEWTATARHSIAQIPRDAQIFSQYFIYFFALSEIKNAKWDKFRPNKETM